MALTLHTLTAAPRRRRRRVGRGDASGRGTYSGRGLKGQRSRSGGSRGITRRSMQQFFRRIPKQGGFQRDTRPVAAIGLGTLSRAFAQGATVTPRALVTKGLVPSGADVKLLNNGTLAHALTVKGCRVSAAAAAAITKAGGTIV